MKQAIKIILILMILGWLYYRYSTTDNKLSQINSDIAKNDSIVRKQESIIAEATKQKERAEKIREVSQTYLNWMAEINGEVQTTTPTEKQAILSWEQKTQALTESDKPRTKTNIACLEWATINISEWYREDFIEIKDCWAFSDYWIKWCYQDSKHIPCLLNNDLTELNKLMWL